jgi:hypothetical protein
VRGDSLHASRSFKYFGQGHGVSAYTFVDERNFLWHSLMISAADRESAYVIDGLMHNDVVKSDIHSTDSHGYTEAVFGLTHLLGFSLELSLPHQTGRKGTGRRGQGKSAAPDCSPLSHVMGSHQHARRVRLLRRKAPRHARYPAPEKSSVEMK